MMYKCPNAKGIEVKSDNLLIYISWDFISWGYLGITSPFKISCPFPLRLSQVRQGSLWTRMSTGKLEVLSTDIHISLKGIHLPYD